ncbi:TetR/AcrR family transcriptional regulator [Zobellia roscoffensis]|uniref:TetR/AcrR family transcriptional regulator n=1 Tax=Zobellia roscoffensis TaxID=2779508 RepID=UPI00188D073F|nr:TetR/AcrR family transcriptional regulator [Zobellia roscoffensis]
MAKESVKDRIISAASDLFYIDGYNQTGINKILEVAQVSKDSMYRHFRSKEAIAVAYLEKRHWLFMQGLEEFVVNEKDGNDKVLAVFDCIEYYIGKFEFRGCGFQNIITDLPKGQDSIVEAVRIHINDFHLFIYNELKKNAIADKKAKELSAEIFVLLEGALILSQIQKSTAPINVGKRACRKILNM